MRADVMQVADVASPPLPSPSSAPWRLEQRRALRLGIVGAVMGALALSAWAALAPLASAVVAEGTVKSLGERKSVVHAEGGIVAAIHVKDGDRVTVGQTLVTLADERVAASAQALREQGAAQALKAQRLQAETTGAPFVPDVQALQGFAVDERGNSVWSSHTDAQGREDWQRAVKDDGSVDWTDFDQAGEFDHRVWSNHSDTQGREDWRDVVLDDGGRDFTDFDQTNVRGDRVVTTRYDIRGLEDWRDATLDDGSRDWSDFDQTNVRADSVVASHFDAQGREDWRNAVMDDGRRDWTDFDQDGSQGWNRAESHYDAQGREDYSDFFMDDGRRNSFDHDQDGSHAWSRFDAGFDASGHLDASTRYFDDGSRLSIDYDHFGAGVNEMLGYNAQGQLNLIAREYHGIVLTSGGRWNPAYGDGLHVVTVINANTGALSTPIQSPAPISVPDPDPWPNAHAEVGPMTPA